MEPRLSYPLAGELEAGPHLLGQGEEILIARINARTQFIREEKHTFENARGILHCIAFGFSRSLMDQLTGGEGEGAWRRYCI